MSLLLWLPLNGNLNNQGLTNASVTNNGATVNTSGKIGQCYSFDGTDDYISIPVDVAKSITGPFSAAFWVKILSWNKAYQAVFGICGTSASWAQELACFQRSNQQNSFVFTFADGTNSITSSLYTGTLNLNEWYHFACVYDGSKAYIYQNGEKLKDYTPSFTPNLTIAQSFNLGRSHTGYQDNMLLNDFRFYNHALSPLEIKEISKGLVLHYHLSNEGCENVIKNSRLSANYTTWTSSANGIAAPEFITKDGYECLHITGVLQKYRTFTPYFTVKNDSRYLGVPQPGDKYTLSMDVLFENVVKGTTNYFISFYASAETIDGTRRAPSGIRNSGHMLSDTGDNLDPDKLNGNGWVRTWRSIEFGDYNWSNPNYTFEIYLRDFTGDVYIKNVKVEVGDTVTPWTPNPTDAEYSALGYDTNVVYDCSGLQNNGEKAGTIKYVPDSPRYYMSTQFVDNTSTVTVKQCFPYNMQVSELTVSCWFKTDTVNSTYPNLCSFGENYFARMRLQNSQTLYTVTRVGSTSVAHSFPCGKSVLDNVWHMATYVFKDGVHRCFLDGVEVGTSFDDSETATYLTQSSNNASAWHLGGYTASSEKFIGCLSDVRMYATAFSSEEVLALYQKAAIVVSNGTLMAYEYSEV